MAGNSGVASSTPAKDMDKAHDKVVATGTAAAEKKKAENPPKDLILDIPGYNWVKHDVGEC